MNNKAKIKMLRDMKPHIGIQKRGGHEGQYFGFCDVLKFKLRVRRHDSVFETLSWLGISKPKQAYIHGFWYPQTDIGTEIRINKINQAIKRLQK